MHAAGPVLSVGLAAGRTAAAGGRRRPGARPAARRSAAGAAAAHGRRLPPPGLFPGAAAGRQRGGPGAPAASVGADGQRRVAAARPAQTQVSLSRASV